MLSKSATDMKDSYNKLLKNTKEMNEKTEEARTRVTEMKATGDAYFAGRAATIKKKSGIQPCRRRRRSGWTSVKSLLQACSTRCV